MFYWGEKESSFLLSNDFLKSFWLWKSQAKGKKNKYYCLAILAMLIGYHVCNDERLSRLDLRFD